MASQPRQLSIEKQTYKGAVPEGLAAVQMPTGEVGTAAAAGFSSLAEKFGKWADADAKADGERDAKIAAASNDFSRTGQATIYGRARDATALDAQVAAVTATYRDRTLALFDQHRDDPEGLRSALSREAQAHEAELPAEARSGFRTRASDIGVVLQRQAIANGRAVRESQQRADGMRRSTESQQQQQRILDISPADGPEAEAAVAEVRRMGAEDIQRLRDMTASGLHTPEKGEQLIQEEQRRIEGRIIAARASRLQSPEAIDAYRADLQRRAREGTLSASVDLGAVDAELAKLGQQRRVEGDRQQRELQTRLDDALTRAMRGQMPTAAEFTELEQQAGRLGARGQVALATMRGRMTLGQRLAGLSLPEQDAVVREVEAAQRSASRDVSSLPAGMRNNNPGNIKYLPSLRTLYSGVVGPSVNTDQGDPQAVFESPEAGMRAMYQLLVKKYDAGQRSATDLITRQGTGWTPGNTAAANNVARSAGLAPGADTNLRDPAAARRFMRGLINQEHGAEAGALYTDAMIDAAISGAPLPAPRSAASITRGGAENVQWLRDQVNANRTAMNADLLGYAAERGLFGNGGITAVDMNAAPDQLAAQMTARVNQVDAVAPRLGQASPSYLRPDDKAALQGVVQQGGERALTTVEAIVRGGGRRATAILKEIGGDAPALAHAASISASTGDRTFARTIAEGLAARQVAGARPARPSPEDMADAERAVLGASLRGMTTDERERTQAAVGVWAEVMAQRRGIDLKSNATALLEEGFRAARGETRQGDNTYGGITAYRGRGWFGGEVQVQVPPQIRQDRFGAVIGAITDQDLAGLPNPPVMPGGGAMDAGALRRMQPIFGPGGYRWSMPPDSSGNRRPVMGRDGTPFVLDLNALEPELRRRVPDGFR